MVATMSYRFVGSYMLKILSAPLKGGGGGYNLSHGPHLSWSVNSYTNCDLSICAQSSSMYTKWTEKSKNMSLIAEAVY